MSNEKSGGAAPDAGQSNDDPIVYRYSRKQAIADGVLVDVTAWANEMGFQLPVAITAKAWNRFVVPAAELRTTGDSEQLRLTEVLSELRAAIGRLRTAGKPSDRVTFRVAFHMTPDRIVTVRVHAVCGPGDVGQAVLTLMLEGEN